VAAGDAEGNNAGSDTSAPGTSTQDNITSAAFVDAAEAGGYDLNPAASGALDGNGDPVSATDIEDVSNTDTIGALAIVGAATVEATAPDGADFGDTASTIATLGAAAADGVDLGDAAAVEGVLGAAGADGAVFGDSATAEVTVEAAAADGVALGDTAAAQGVLGAAASDGATFGDSGVVEALLEALAADGLLCGDSAVAALAVIEATCADGIVLGDSTAVVAVLLATAPDGVVLGDPASVALAGILSIRDRIMRNVEASLESIALARGFDNDVAGVLRVPGGGFTVHGYPFIVLRETDTEEQSVLEGNVDELQGDLQVEIGLWVRDHSAPPTAANSLLMDVERALMHDCSWTWSVR
jgi:hypothetical protein